MRFPRWVLPVLLLTSGCVSDVPETLPALPSLADFTQCTTRYPNNQSVPCENTFEGLSVESEVPGDWICVAKQGRTNDIPSHWRIYRSSKLPPTSLLGDDLGFWYSDKWDHAITGGLRFTTGGTTKYYNWTDAPPTGFVRLKGLTASDTAGFYADLYRWEYKFPDNASSQGVLRPLWSLHQPDEFWVLLRLDWKEQAYYFDVMTGFGGHWFPEDGELRGEDFLFRFANGVFMRGGVPSNNLGIDQAGC